MADVDFIQPRYAILELWRSVARRSYREGRWHWSDAVEPNSISDAEQLLCVLYPATNRPQLRLEEPNSIPHDVLDVLRTLGDSVQIPRALIAAVEDFLDRHTHPDGTPEFGAGGYFEVDDAAETGDAPVTDEQLDLDNVVSYATSINLCLAALGFLLQYRERGARGDWVNRVDRLLPRVRVRLTAALTGLLRSFTMNPVSVDSAEGRELIRLLNQDGRPDHSVITEFNDSMQIVRGRLREARLGVARAQDLDNPNLLFEIGWTWSIADDAPPFRLEDETDQDGSGIGEQIPVDLTSAQRKGYALSKPYLYFTLIALEAIELLSAERTRVLGLLDARQERLASALFIRRDLTQIYWSVLARFGAGKWPLEDLPWRTLDGVESDYLTLLVCAVLLQDLTRREANEDDLRRLQPLMSELANRGRITRRALRADQALEIHRPGLRVTLDGSDVLGPPLVWRLTDFSPLLLRRVSQAATLTSDPRRRDELLSLASDIWNHMSSRVFIEGDYVGLWDDPTRVFHRLDKSEARLSWTLNFRVVEALVGVWGSQANRATRNRDLGELAGSMISEAEYKVNQELAYTVALQTPLQNTLQELRGAVSRAKTIAESQPATAMALCVPILQELDRIAQGRTDAQRSE
ncbi:MAG TPA: SCO2524 family protein [Actinospica sp.]|jgi:hypothetical protein|nr:SCO2524 family protein [Actinospica sp.]